MTALVVDVGSSSVRALLVDEALHVVTGSVARREHAFDHATADAEHLRSLVEGVIDEALQHPQAEAITAVGITTFVGNMLGVDADNRPLTPLYTYADTRSADDVTALAEKIDIAEAHQRTGCPHHSAYHPGRLHWLRRTQADTFQQVHQWIDLATYLYRAWFRREVPMSYSVASWSGLLNREKLAWDAEWLDVLDMTEAQFPALADVDDVQQGLADGRWPALQDVPFYLALGDGAAANVGSGGVSKERVVLTVGTTAALRVVHTNLSTRVPDGLWSYRLDKDHAVTGGATSEGGNIFEWATRTLKLNDDEIEERLQAREPDAHGLTFLPLLAGERSPGYAVDAAGAVHGLRLNSTPLDILQAGLEGVAVRLAMIADSLNTERSPVYAGGGALFSSPAFAQMIANAMNRPLYLLAEPEVTARGVAAVMTAQWEKAAQPRIERGIEPQAEHVAALGHLRGRVQRLYRFSQAM